VARLLGELIAERVLANTERNALPTLLIPVPLHPKRLRQRGYNQAILIAKQITKLTQIPLNHSICQRIRETPPQSKTTALTRRSNMVGAFKMKQYCPEKHIALIDDVMTTGATVDGLSHLLKQQGTEKISIWCAARV